MNKKNFSTLKKLYHYTKLDTALKILESHSLRYGKLSSMNDIHESSKAFYSKDLTAESYSKIKDEVLKYRQISFSLDKCEDKHNLWGFNLHQMWGLYGDKFTGVCLVFDKEAIDSLDPNTTRRAVDYEYTVDSSYISESIDNDLEKEIFNHKEDIFFSKRKEWEHEQEYRIIKRFQDSDEDGYLNFDTSLKFVIISDILKEENETLYNKHLQTLKDTIEKHNYDIPILLYGNGGLFGYQLYDIESHQIWNSNDGYDKPQIGVNCDLDL